MVQGSLLIYKLLLPDSSDLSIKIEKYTHAEIENMYLQNVTTQLEKNNFMSIESNNKMIAYILHGFYFSTNSYLMYFTKETICGGLGNLKKTGSSPR